jgi:hypothetical protein
MLSPVSHRHRHLAGRQVPPSFWVRQRSLDHQVRLAVSLAALAGGLLFALLDSTASELPSKQAVAVPALQAKS